MVDKKINLSLLVVCLLQVTPYISSELHPMSTVTTRRGHHPPMFCTLTNAVLNTTDGVIYLRTGQGQISSCSLPPHVDIWDYKDKKDLSDVSCVKKYDVGNMFTFFYWKGYSNYYHLTLDTLIPLYSEIYHEKVIAGNQAFLPTVEKSRLKGIDWESGAFDEKKKIWYTMFEALIGEGDILPMDKALKNLNGNICFDMLKVGTPNVDFTDSQLLKGFITFMKKKLQIDQDVWKRDAPRAGLISRKNRRLIINEEDLLQGLNEVIPTDLIIFDGMSLYEQVALMSKYTIIAGINGAGLMNGLYLPPHGVVIQMAPFETKLNVKFYGTLLSTRGPYLEWWNTHEDKHHPFPHDTYDNNPNTEVAVEEVQNIFRKAIQLSNQNLRKIRNEDL